MGSWRRKNLYLITSALFLSLMLIAGCGGGGSDSTASSSTPAAGVSGIALPTEVSAVSTGSEGSVAASLGYQVRALGRAVNALPSDSDYHTTVTTKYVDEPTLEIFGIIETILKAVAQTNYADADNVGTSAADATPYKAMVAWEDDHEGRTQKQLQEWVVKSFMTQEGGEDVNVVHLWIDEGEEQVKVESKVYRAPTQDAEGNYLDYGIWQITANFTLTDTGESSGSFFADASLDGSMTVLRMTDSFEGPEDMMGQEIIITEETKAIMYKTATIGYGRALIPDWEYCFDFDFGAGETSPCAGLTELAIPAHNIKYAYNADYLGIQVLDESDVVEETIYEDRNDVVQMAYRYGLFNATDGSDVEKSKSFGFPIRYTDGNDNQRFGYYGAWQGRHQLWAGQEGTLANGTSVEKDAWGDEESVSYTTRTYPGSLTKRGLVDASLSQIEDIPVEIWLSDHFDLRYDTALSPPGWKKCSWEITGTDQNGYDTWEESCNETAYDLSVLTATEDHRKWIDAGREVCDNYETREGCTYRNYTFNGTTFVETEWSDSPNSTYGSGDWADGDHLWVNIGGSTYITYTGIFGSGATGWVEKTLTEFDEQTWTPTFDEDSDVAFDFPRDREYYINNKGVNFVVRRTGSTDSADSYEAKMETQSVVRPDNLGSVFPNGTSYFAIEWESEDSRSTFEFDDSTMLLKYKSVGGNDSNASIGDTVTQGNWGLAAYDADDNRINNAQGNAIQFNWEYATESNPWGAITYLVKADNTIQYLDDPIMLDPIALTTVGGDTLTFSLQFDGWMHGLPDMHWELQKNDFMMTEDLKNKVVNIPAGTEVTDSVTGGSYYVKPLEVGVILFKEEGVPVDAPDLTQADSVDLDTIPTPATISIGSMPTGVQLKYVEGKSVL